MEDFQGCELTVGEVREHRGLGGPDIFRCRVGSTRDDGRWWVCVEHETDVLSASKIVEVAPENQARVTAGAPWLSQVCGHVEP
jgi:hypothetical protein